MPCIELDPDYPNIKDVGDLIDLYRRRDGLYSKTYWQVLPVVTILATIILALILYLDGRAFARMRGDVTSMSIGFMLIIIVAYSIPWVSTMVTKRITEDRWKGHLKTHD